MHGPDWKLPPVELYAARPRAAVAPPAPIKRQNATLTYKGRTRTIAEWAKLRGMPFTTLYNRLNDKRRPHPWPVEKALNTPVRAQRRPIRADSKRRMGKTWEAE